MAFEDWEAKMCSMFTGVVQMPAVSGYTVRDMLTDWKAEREELLHANQVLTKDNARLFGERDKLQERVRELKESLLWAVEYIGDVEPFYFSDHKALQRANQALQQSEAQDKEGE